MQSTVGLCRHAPLNMIELPQHPRELSNSLPKQRGGGKLDKEDELAKFSALVFFNNADLYRKLNPV